MKDYIDYIIEESINKILLTEMGMDATKFADKYGEILDVLVDNLVSITMYPNSQAVPHWRQRVGALVKRFINLDINPKHRNKENYRLALLQSAVTETLNSADYFPRRFAALPLRRRTGYGNAVRHSGHRLCLLLFHGRGRYTVYDVLSCLYFHTDAARKPAGGHPLCSG